MTNVFKNGKVYSFGEVKKNSYGEYTVSVAVNGSYSCEESQDMKIFETDRVSAKLVRTMSIDHMLYAGGILL